MDAFAFLAENLNMLRALNGMLADTERKFRFSWQIVNDLRVFLAACLQA